MYFGVDIVLIGLRAEMAVKPGSRSEPMFCDFPGIVNKSFTIPGIVFSKYIFVKIYVWSSDSN